MKDKHKSTIGGQAVIEGVMMKGPDKVSMSVRLHDGMIDNECWDYKGKRYAKLPIIRGIVNFFSMMVLGIKCITKSAEKVEYVDQGLEDTGKDIKAQKLLDSGLGKVIMTAFMIIGVVASIFLFMYLPAFFAKLVGNVIEYSSMFRSLLEGIIKIILFISYICLTSLMKDIETLYRYHGAEHKAIACYEDGEDLTIKNVKKYSRLHPRCGTSFILIVLVISILVFSAISWDSVIVRTITKLTLMPIVVGIAYEVIKLTARYDNCLTKIFVAPGLWLQKITTKEPTDEQIEVAINALIPVIPENKNDDSW